MFAGLLLPATPQLAEAAGSSSWSRARRSAKKVRARRHKRWRPRVKVTRDTVAGGRHWRIRSRGRTLHVWRPRGYRHSRAGVVLYVHGHHTSADRSWSSFKLAEQFKQSKRNALFIVVDGPRKRRHRVKFYTPREVLRLVKRHARIRIPRGRVVAFAHSSGSRTVHRWLRTRTLDRIVLLDGLFAREGDYARWLKRSKRRRVVLVGKQTHGRCLRLAKSFRRSVRLRRIPDETPRRTRRLRRARVITIRSQFGHSALVFNRRVIPVVLGLSGLGRVRRTGGEV
jgi:hypothetical protein